MKHIAYEKHAIASITCLLEQQFLNQMNYCLKFYKILYVSTTER